MSAAQAAAITGEVVLEDNELARRLRSGHRRADAHGAQGDALGHRTPARAGRLLPHACSPAHAAHQLHLGQKQRAKSVEKDLRQPGASHVVRSRERARRRPAHHVHRHRHAQETARSHSTASSTTSLTCMSRLSTIPTSAISNPPTPDTHMVAEHMLSARFPNEEIYPHFSNNLGYWGVRYPTKTFNTNQSQFCLIQSPEQGIYVAHARSRPSATCCSSPSSSIPEPSTGTATRSRAPTRSPACPCISISAPATSSLRIRTRQSTLSPVVIRPYSGDWHAGLDIYQRLARHVVRRTPRIPEWVKDVNSWQQLQIDGAEQDYSIPYRELIKYGTECAENGVGCNSTRRLASRRAGWRRSVLLDRSRPGHLAGIARRDRADPGQGREDDPLRQAHLCRHVHRLVQGSALPVRVHRSLRQQVRVGRLQLRHSHATGRHQQPPARHHGRLLPGISRHRHARIRENARAWRRRVGSSTK